MNRVQAREFAEAWVIDAKVLLDAGRWHAAYYLAGYAVECGLKACVLAHIEAITHSAHGVLPWIKARW